LTGESAKLLWALENPNDLPDDLPDDLPEA
jgi:hypothetical protein